MARDTVTTPATAPGGGVTPAPGRDTAPAPAPGAPVRAVFFDIGDTLVCRPHVGPGRRIAEALGLPAEAARTITRLVFHESFDSPAALARRLGGEFRLADGADAEIAAIWRAQEEEPVEIAGATDLVAAARSAGARVGVISNIWAPYATGFRRACPVIVGLVESWHLSYQAGVAKPDAALFTAALAALEVPASAAVMIGDSLDKDIRPALGLGMRALWVPAPAPSGDTAGSPPEPTPAGALLARDLAEARAILLMVLGNAPAFGVSTAVS